MVSYGRGNSDMSLLFLSCPYRRRKLFISVEGAAAKPISELYIF